MLMPESTRVVTTDAEIDAAIRQARIYEKYDQRVVRATYSERTDRFMLHLENGATHSIPRGLLQGLTDANSSDLNHIELLGRGTGLYWPALDVAHLVSGLLAGVYGSTRWMDHLQLESEARRISA
jgi:predicted TPR repeat methyltransferase